jgi:hypothetical protein
VALTGDDEGTTAELAAEHGLTFPVGHPRHTAVVSALLEASRNGWASATTLGFLAVGSALLVVFGSIENRLRSGLRGLRVRVGGRPFSRPRD